MLIYILLQRIQNGDIAIGQALIQLGVPETHLNDIEFIKRLLRIRMVQEWNSNLEYYQGFLTDDFDLSELAENFLDSSQFSGNVGDLMTLTLANVLHMPITIFTSAQNMPIVCILPTTQNIVSTTLSIHSG